MLRDKTRRSLGRGTEPTAAVIDAQSVKTSANVAETSQGIDAGKKIKGCKRHVITDTLGLVLAVLVTAASVHDTTGGKLLVDDLAAAHPTVSKVWAEGGYQSSILNHGTGLGIDVEVVQRRTKGFEPLPKRWVIERTFGWLMQHRRLARDYEASRRGPGRCSMGRWLTKCPASSQENLRQRGEPKRTCTPERCER
ncbi:transposase [Streptomyces sp. NPDC005549]|uniref:transposase n=1 Tax=Streptomyces sp. NPDC005549 TaxID=3154888 RepID=UPI00339FC103